MGVLSWVEGRPPPLRCMSCLPLEGLKGPSQPTSSAPPPLTIWKKWVIKNALGNPY